MPQSNAMLKIYIYPLIIWASVFNSRKGEREMFRLKVP